ncbi:MAG: hypothetical protein ACNA7G_01910 [Methylobacter sp.]
MLTENTAAIAESLLITVKRSLTRTTCPSANLHFIAGETALNATTSDDHPGLSDLGL